MNFKITSNYIFFKYLQWKALRSGGVATLERHRILSVAGLEKVAQTVESQTLHLDTVRKDGWFMEVVKKEIAREGKNNHAAAGITISKSTLYRYYIMWELHDELLILGLQLNQEQGDFVPSTIEPLSIACVENGIISEEEFQRYLDRPDPIDNCPVKNHGMPLNQMTTSRQRAMKLWILRTFHCATQAQRITSTYQGISSEACTNGGSSSRDGGHVGAAKSDISTTASTVTNNDNSNNIMEDAVAAAEDVDEPPKKVRKNGCAVLLKSTLSPRNKWL